MKDALAQKPAVRMKQAERVYSGDDVGEIVFPQRKQGTLFLCTTL